MDSAVCKAGKLEVDVFDPHGSQLIVHRLDIFECSERRINLNGDGKEASVGLRSAEGFDIERNIAVNIACIESCELSALLEVVAVSLCHSDVAGLVVIRKVCSLCRCVIRQHDILDSVAVGITSG